MNIFRFALVALFTLGVANAGLFAQEEESDSDMLTIGSVAPALDIEHWVQDGDGNFKPVTEFEDGKVYMVEFWATWCGPCIASMPHISEMQQEYADKGFQVVSVSTEDLETVEEFLERTVKGDDGRTYRDLTSTYCLTTDPDGSVQEDYMEAAQQNGIPTAFLVGKSGHVEWIGHPMDKLDSVIEKVLDDDWDREEFAVAFKARQDAKALQTKLTRLMRQGKMDEALEVLNEAIEKSDDESAVKPLKRMRAQVLIMTGAEDAGDAMRELTSNTDSPQVLNQMAWAVVEMKNGGQDINEDLIKAATAAAEKAIELDPKAGHIMDTLAHLVHMQGDLDRAIELEEKAVELSGDDFPEIEEFLDKLKKEKSGDDEDDD